MPIAHPKSGSGYEPTVFQLAYFPPGEYAAAWERNLLDATNYRSHVDYRREVELQLRALAEQPTAVRVVVVPLNVEDLVAYATRAEKDPASRKTRLAYTDVLYSSGRAGTRWPPERNSPCWCGSGEKYKKCCGSPEFLATEPADPASLVLRIEPVPSDSAPDSATSDAAGREAAAAGTDGDGSADAAAGVNAARRVAVPSNTRLDRVHLMFQQALGAAETDAYAFENDEYTIVNPESADSESIDGDLAADVERLVSIASELGARFTYRCGPEERVHTVTVEEIRPAGPENAFTILHATA